MLSLLTRAVCVSDGRESGHTKPVMHGTITMNDAWEANFGGYNSVVMATSLPFVQAEITVAAAGISASRAVAATGAGTRASKAAAPRITMRCSD
jgi:hypothetical protein